MRISVGIDIAKKRHGVNAIDADGVVRIDRKLLNTPTDMSEFDVIKRLMSISAHNNPLRQRDFREATSIGKTIAH